MTEANNESAREAHPSIAAGALPFDQSINPSFAAFEENRDSVSNPDVLRNIFPCHTPNNLAMRSYEARLQTFSSRNSNWPVSDVRATPQQFAAAGFFYVNLDARDRVKCWYCNGGLQNWERDHNPWEEHAKWFPLCEYVLQKKGPDSVCEIVTKFPRLCRPNFYKSTASDSVAALRELLRSPSPNPPGSPQNLIIDPRDELVERNTQVSREMANSELVAQASSIGFSEGHIRSVLRKRFSQADCSFPDLESLVEALQNSEEPGSDQHKDDPAQEGYSNNLTPTEQLRKLEESRMCKRCHKNVACVLFVPCGNVACCVDCSELVEVCPVCKEFIRSKYICRIPNTESRTF